VSQVPHVLEVLEVLIANGRSTICPAYSWVEPNKSGLYILFCPKVQKPEAPEASGRTGFTIWADLEFSG
jgi:hypothetical protein